MSDDGIANDLATASRIAARAMELHLQSFPADAATKAGEAAYRLVKVLERIADGEGHAARIACEALFSIEYSMHEVDWDAMREKS